MMRFCLILFLFLQSVYSHGQSLSIDLKSGLNIMERIWIEDFPNPRMYDVIYGGNAGTSVIFHLNEIIGVSTGLELNQRGFVSFLKFRHITATDTSNYKIPFKTRTNHLDLPLQLFLKYDVLDNFNFFGQAGPYVSYMMYGKHDTGSVHVSEVVDVRTAFAPIDFSLYENPRWDYGINLSAGFEIHNIFLDARFSFGLRHMGNENLQARTPYRGGMISIGYRHTFEKRKDQDSGDDNEL